jgi:hypothetical protein
MARMRVSNSSCDSGTSVEGGNVAPGASKVIAPAVRHRSIPAWTGVDRLRGILPHEGHQFQPRAFFRQQIVEEPLHRTHRAFVLMQPGCQRNSGRVRARC